MVQRDKCTATLSACLLVVLGIVAGPWSTGTGTTPDKYQSGIEN